MKPLKEWLKNHPHHEKLMISERCIEEIYKKQSISKTGKKAKKYKKILGDASVYGEIQFISLIKLLDLVEPKSHETIVDLGCGTGKTLLTAGLCFDVKSVIGVEYIKEIYDVAQSRLNDLKSFLKSNGALKASPINLIQGDLFDYKFKKADIVFINATCFSHQMMKRLFEKFELLKVGTRVIITSHQIPSNKFKELHSGRYPMSWGLNSARVYIKQDP